MWIWHLFCQTQPTLILYTFQEILEIWIHYGKYYGTFINYITFWKYKNCKMEKITQNVTTRTSSMHNSVFGECELNGKWQTKYSCEENDLLSLCALILFHYLSRMSSLSLLLFHLPMSYNLFLEYLCPIFNSFFYY